GQSHRAFVLALDLASRSLARIQMIGVYGVQQDSFEPSPLAEDSVWQRGWLDRLVQMYALEAAKSGIELRTSLIEASHQEKLAEIFNSSEFDLIVLPRRFSAGHGASDAARTLHQSLAGAAAATILFCP